MGSGVVGARRTCSEPCRSASTQSASPRASVADGSLSAAWMDAKEGRASGRCALHAAINLVSHCAANDNPTTIRG